jgi:acetoin utilization deacetylase AcuC-like enzyme
MTTLYVTHPRCVEHDLPGHPEHAGRLRAIWRRLDEAGLNARMTNLQAEPATDEMILSVHTPEYLELLRQVESKYFDRTVRLDADTYFTPTSREISYLAAGGTVQAVDAILKGTANNSLVVVRPPGHHAMPEHAMGFCIFGNIAIAARYSQRHYNIKRVMIVDYDVHHGNGTEAMFYDDPSVLFISYHQYGRGFYPATGAIEDTGTGAGEGYNVNIALPSGHGDTTYAATFAEIIAPLAARFQPELILVSAGFDAHWTDPIAGMRLSVTGFDHLNRELMGLANTYCGGKIAFVVEGGYNVDALGYGVAAAARTLLSDPMVDDPMGPPRETPYSDASAVIERIKRVHGL